MLLFLLLPAFAVDREAFTITRYQFEAQVDRTSHVLAVTGRLTLRNDSKVPQKHVTLQVSSSLAWNGIALNGKPLQWLGENYTSDIDHTGSLSEAIVTLPTAAAPATTVTLDVQYGGRITPDATRLTRIGIPEEVAARNDWDQISDSFTAIRGLGYVAWYPVAIEAVSLSDGTAVFDAIARWKQRHDRSEFDARIIETAPATQPPLCIATNAPVATCGEARELTESQSGAKLKEFTTTLHLDGLGETVPTFAIANYVELSRPTVTLSAPCRSTLPWRGITRSQPKPTIPCSTNGWAIAAQPPRVIELTDPNANPWQNGAVLFTPLREAQTATLQLLLLPAQVAARFHSPHAWIQDGLERFLQVMSVENRSGRRVALEFLDQYREPLAQAEELAHPKTAPAGSLGQCRGRQHAVEHAR